MASDRSADEGTVRELVVISGKGGSGKTSLLASFAVLLPGRAVVVDCDVDAPDLHLLLEPEVIRRTDFVGGAQASLDPDSCMGCGRCIKLCRFQAIDVRQGSNATASSYHVDPFACEGCGVCAHFCPVDAISLQPVVSGQWSESRSRAGPMVHARMRPGAENSGRLVTQLRREAVRVAREHRRELILVDGSPGIGCPVIASLTGADLALMVVEPTLSGAHDFRRIAQLARQLGVPSLLVINKSDINPSMADALERESHQLAIPLLGRLPYDSDVTAAQVARLTVVEHSDGPAARGVRQLVKGLGQWLDDHTDGSSQSCGPLTMRP